MKHLSNTSSVFAAPVESTVSAADNTLAAWLQWIESVHPQAMDLTLNRARQVAERLQVLSPAPKVVTVGGTNGKGSTVRLLEAALLAAELRVGTITSPHLHRFNERICINGEPASDINIVQALQAVDAARGDVTLTYYEYAVLAALWLMQKAQVDVAVLEVGLGGRLDAVNIVDADIAVITHIGIDHVSVLGEDQEAIGAEKAGIFRAGQTVVIGDPTPPASLLEKAHSLNVWPKQRQRHFQLCNESAELLLGDHKLSLRQSRLAGTNLATALAVVHYGFPELDVCASCKVMKDIGLAGRLQQVTTNIWLDVAHNPDGARHLSTELGARLKGQRVHCIYATLKDKDAGGFVAELQSLVSSWYLGATTGNRGRDSMQLKQALSGFKKLQISGMDDDLAVLLQQAVTQQHPDDALLICGSFECISTATKWLAAA